MSTRQPSTRPPPAGTSSVRRNLFGQQPTRRSTGTVLQVPAMELPPDDGNPDIIIKDDEGSMLLGIPAAPPTEVEDQEESDCRTPLFMLFVH